MNVRQTIQVGLIAAVAAWCGVGTPVAAQPISGHDREGIEVLARGPVHEAFAETVLFDPGPGMIVPKAPPAAIEELPPAQKLEGANVAWIPGYWAWEDEREDFLWVSGIWRALPPGRQWVPGYWGRLRQGYQWTSGYWSDARQTEVEYLPEPPESVEAGPNIAAPSADSSWLPGCWVWQQNRYAWRPGFWTAVYPNWVWVPAHYLWAPRGYVYVNGYWDYAVARRGTLFAPVSFNQSVYSQRGFSYTPSTVIDLGVFASHLFLRPNYGHYYYGDYYGANYATAGFYPSFSYSSGRHGYDPIFAHQRWDHRQDGDWERRRQVDFQHRRDHEDARPPRTFAAQQDLVKKGLTGQDQERVFAQPLKQYTQAKESPLRFLPLADEERQNAVRHAQEVYKFRAERQKRENEAGRTQTQTPANKSGTARVTLPQSPIRGKSPDQIGKDLAPPQRHVIPNPDPKVVPKPRLPRGNPNVVEPREQPQNPPKSRPQSQPKNGSSEKPKAASNHKPQEKPKSESGGKPPGASNDKPQGGSREKPQGRSKQKPQDKPKEKPKK